MRLDKFLAEKHNDISRSEISKLIKEGRILVNGKASKKPGFQVSEKDEVSFPKNLDRDKEIVLEAADLELEIVYEDKAVLVVNKPAGLTVHPAAGTEKELTLVNGILDKIDVESFEEKERPGIVHRLDKDTSGLIIVAKNQKVKDDLVAQFQEHSVKKHYVTLVYGFLKHKKSQIDSPLGRALKDRKKMRLTASGEGKDASSLYEVLEEMDLKDAVKVSLLDVEIKTGRTHQIRVHMSAIAHPVVGDGKYGNRKINQFFKKEFGLKRQFLHAYKLKFKSPDTRKIVDLKIGLPEDLVILPSLKSF